jgi:signal transduction histidine kinase
MEISPHQMTDSAQLPLAQSIGHQLLKKIFGVYCIAAVIVTLFQGWAEYDLTRDRVYKDMADFRPLVEESLANALWHLDLPLLEDMANGILTQNSIVGIRIYDDYKQLLLQGGDIATIGNSVSADATSQSAYRYGFSLFDPTGLSSDDIGRVEFFSSRDVVIENVIPTLTTLLSAAVVKTSLLWLIFIYFSRELLSRPLSKLISTVRSISLEEDLSGHSQDRHQNQLNELGLLSHVIEVMERKLEQTLFSLRTALGALEETNSDLQQAIEQSHTLSILFNNEGQILQHTQGLTLLAGGDEGADGGAAQLFFNNYFFSAIPWDSIQHQQGQGELSTGLELWSGEIHIIDHTGAPRCLVVTLSPARSRKTGATNFLCTSSDITEIKQMEQQLVVKNTEQQAIIRKLEQARQQLIQSEKMATIGQLAAGVAHEINNPMGFITGNIATLKQYVEALRPLLNLYMQLESITDDRGRGQSGEKNVNSNGKQKARLLKQIAESRNEADLDFILEDIEGLIADTQEGAERVKTIVQGMNAFGRLDTGEMAYCDINQGIEATLKMVANELKYCCTLTTSLGDLPKIRCNLNQLNQVFTNLLVNAAQALDGEGEICISSKRVDDKIEISVADTGRGIEKEHLDQLFTPFFTTKPIGQGTGLGLYISYEIVQQHGGSIEVQSEMAKGTTFTLRLPLAEVSAPIKVRIDE